MIVSRHQQNLQRRSFFFSKSFVLLCLILVLVLVMAYVNELRRQEKINQRVSDLQKEATRLENSNLELTNLIGYAKTEEYTELKARESYNYKKEGENVLIIVRPEDENQGSGAPKISNWRKWLNFISPK
jgi:cell division protein FtsB